MMGVPAGDHGSLWLLKPIEPRLAKSDEPASVLLERIRAELAKGNGSTAKRKLRKA
jgi:hypothetical protein